MQYDTLVGVLDDHVHAHELGIPSIDLMDTSYGEPKPYTFGSLWHTMEDTPDKVSAESLESVGRLVELGLLSNAFVDVSPTDEEGNLSGPADDEPTPEEVESAGSKAACVDGRRWIVLHFRPHLDGRMERKTLNYVRGEEAKRYYPRTRWLATPRRAQRTPTVRNEWKPSSEGEGKERSCPQR